MLGKGWGTETISAETDTIAYFIRKKSIKDVIALDVGANFGNWSAELLTILPFARIFAFEPSKEAFFKLQSRFVDIDAVKCFNVALGKDNKIANLYANASSSSLASLSKRRVKHLGIEFEYTEKIKVVTLDSWIEENKGGLQPNVLKMDVEGHELDILHGAKNALLNLEIIQFEFGGANIDTRTFFQDFWYFFLDLGFEIYRITPKGVRIVSHYSEYDETFRTTNYVAVRK